MSLDFYPIWLEYPKNVSYNESIEWFLPRSDPPNKSSLSQSHYDADEEEHLSLLHAIEVEQTVCVFSREKKRTEGNRWLWMVWKQSSQDTDRISFFTDNLCNVLLSMHPLLSVLPSSSSQVSNKNKETHKPCVGKVQMSEETKGILQPRVEKQEMKVDPSGLL